MRGSLQSAIFFILSTAAVILMQANLMKSPFVDTICCKKVNIKVQEEPQAEAAANPQHQQEEKKWQRLTCA